MSDMKHPRHSRPRYDPARYRDHWAAAALLGIASLLLWLAMEAFR